MAGKGQRGYVLGGLLSGYKNNCNVVDVAVVSAIILGAVVVVSRGLTQ